MIRSILIRRSAQFLGTAIVALSLGGCTESPTPTPTPTEPRPSATTSPTSSPTPSQSTTPSATASATRTPSATPSGPISTATPPAGYAQSCAKDIPWGRQVTQPFVCLDAPSAGAKVARGGSVTVRGYVGGSFESNVIIEVRALVDREPGATLSKTAMTYNAPDLGMPGGFSRAVTIPAGAATGPARVTAYFESPRDGSVVTKASADIVIE